MQERAFTLSKAQAMNQNVFSVYTMGRRGLALPVNLSLNMMVNILKDAKSQTAVTTKG